MPRSFLIAPFSLVTLVACAWAAPDPGSRARAADTELAVRELTVFKDGHAFVLREGRRRAGAPVVLADLPVPVLGTFWAYARNGGRVRSVVAARERVEVERTALSLAELLEGNVGKLVDIVDVGNEHHRGTLLGIPARSPAELDRTEAPSSDPRLPQRGTVVLLGDEAGTRALALDRVRDVWIGGQLGSKFSSVEHRSRLTLDVEGAGEADVGVIYVQRGVRWIPGYKLELLGSGRARVELQATLVNDLIDVRGVTVNLVIGVPRFEFADLVDPISLQQIAAQVSGQMQGRNAFANNLSNALMSQVAFLGGGDSAPAGGPAGPAVVGGAAHEDLYVFTLRDVSLRRGERMIVPVSSFELAYEDVYTLELPLSPPLEMQRNYRGEQFESLARELAAPKVLHMLRLKNTGPAPLTTAPALILEGGQVLGQSLLRYTPVGARCDLELGVALDVTSKQEDLETRRTPRAVEDFDRQYTRIDMQSSITLANLKAERLALEVRRSVLGRTDRADPEGLLVQLGPAQFWTDATRPEWWSWWHWPWWWWRFNGLGRCTWNLALDPGQTRTLKLDWHYFWE